LAHPREPQRHGTRVAGGALHYMPRDLDAGKARGELQLVGDLLVHLRVVR